MNKNLLIGAGVFLAVVITGVVFLSKPKVSGDIREITISANEYSLNPTSVTVAKGEKIRLTFTNVGSQFHNLVINEIGVKTKTIGAGKSDIIEFSAPSDGGMFTFFCGIGDHQNLGMEGELKVK